ncbi:hypothetical protein, partial [Burkholderia vietnamiensis]|uniref:hypothetical protein n=2 Tax=Burkholderiaceae TaxID=119060 RepID=UPI001E324B76
DAQEIARHERSFERHMTFYDWRHYITLVERKPGALRNGAPFVTAYFGERDRRFRERDRFGWLGRCAVSIVDFLVSSGRVRAPGRWVWGMSF